ncbi:PEP-CTERM sorting domain-containing protein [Kiritimatiellota bacterium B12222]|nr:PEP-CTERM sorting domain-containing protein [Kiritimatiellota bacterium B12222]
MKKSNLFTKLLLGVAILSLSLCSYGEIILLDNTGSPGTGDNLDGIETVPTTINMPEIPGLQMTITAILGTDTGAELNSTSTSLGINSDNDTDTDAFEAAFGQGFSFSFNQDVSITQLDFTTFDSGEVFNFGGVTIENDDLSNKTTDIYDFSSPLLVSANSVISMSATTGTIGIEKMTLTAIPEPSIAALLLIGMGFLVRFIRKK